MKNLVKIALIALATSATAMTKQEIHSEYKSKELYLSIKHLLQENLITIKEAQELWLEHREQKEI